MDDAFERLGMDRILVLDEEELRERIDRLSGEMHPDAGGERDEFARVREAYGVLASPGKRLRHWLELGGVEWESGGSVPEELMMMFGEVGEVIQRVDGLAGRKAAAQSVLGRSMLEREALELLGEVEILMERVRGMRNELAGRFGGFEASGAAECGGEAVAVARTLLFLERWDDQLRERWAGLAV